MDLVQIGFQVVSGGLKEAKAVLNEFTQAGEAATKSKTALERRVERLQISLQAEKRALEASIVGTKEATQEAKLFRTELQLRAGGASDAVIQSILAEQRENLKLAQSIKDTTEAQKSLDRSHKEAIKSAQAHEKAMEKLNNQALREGKTLLAQHRAEIRAEEKAFNDLHAEALQVNKVIDDQNNTFAKWSSNLQLAQVELKAITEGTTSAKIAAEQFKIEMRALAGGATQAQAEALGRVTKETLEYQNALKVASQEQKKADAIMDEYNKGIRDAEIALDKLNEQSLKEGRALLAAHRKEVEAEERAFAALHQEALKMNASVDKLNDNLQEERLRIKALKEGTASARVEYKLFNIERQAAKTLSGDMLKAYVQEQRALLRTEEAIKLVQQRQNRFTRGTEESTKELRKNSVRASQAAIQFEQFFNQLQGGANPLLAFSQQAADLGIVLGFGLAGAVAGIAGAFVSLLGPAILDLNDKTKTMDQSMNALDESISRTDSSVIELSSSIRNLARVDEDFQTLALIGALGDARQALRDTDEAVEDFISSLDLLESFSIQTARGFVGFGSATFDAFSQRIDELGLSFEELEKKLSSAEGVSISLNTTWFMLARSVLNLKEELELSTSSALRLGDAFGDLQNNVTFENIDTAKEVLIDIIDAGEGGSIKFQKLSKEFLVYAKNVKDAAEFQKVLNDELRGIDTSLRFDEDDTLSDVQEKLAKIREEVAKTGEFEKYKSIYSELTENLDKLSTETFVKYLKQIQDEASLINASVAEQEIANFVKSTNILLTEEQNRQLTEAIEKRELDKLATKEAAEAQQFLNNVLDPAITINQRHAKEVAMVIDLNAKGKLGTLSYAEAMEIANQRRKDSLDALKGENKEINLGVASIENYEAALKAEQLSALAKIETSKKVRVEMLLQAWVQEQIAKGIETDVITANKAAARSNIELAETYRQETQSMLDSADSKRRMQEATQSAVNALNMERLELEANMKGTDEAKMAFELFAFEQSLWASGVNSDMIEGLVKQKEENLKLEKSFEDSTQAQQDFAKLQDEIAQGADRIGTSFQRSGNGIANAFAEASDVILAVGERMRELNEQQERLNASKATESEITEAQRELDAQVLSARLSGISSILGATKNMFDEQSSARKKMHQAELVFQAVEISMGLQRAVVNAVNAVTNQGSGDPYTAFARVAAMTALMAGALSQIGVAFGGSGGSAPSVGPAGTGTTLGDPNAQSESISNSQEMFEDIQLEQLAELRGIRSGLSDLAGGISQLTTSILGVGGLDTEFVGGLGTTDNNPLLKRALGRQHLQDIPVIGDALDIINSILMLDSIFGSTSREITEEGIRILSQSFTDILASGELEAEVFAVVETTKKRLFGLIRGSSTDILTEDIDSDFARQLGAIFGSLGESLLSAADLMGMDVSDALANFTIPELDISFTDKTGEEIEEELSAAIGSIGDQLASSLFPTLLQYQQINEGMFETVLRVTRETVIFEDALEKVADGLDISNEALIDFGQNVIEAIGGLDNFNEAVSEYIDNFFSERERMQFLADDLSEVFESLGLAMPSTNQEFRELVEATASMGAQGADTLAVLLEINEAFAELTETADEFGESLGGVILRYRGITNFFRGIINDIEGFLTDFDFSDRSQFDPLVDALGDDNAVISAVIDMANNFTDAATQLQVAERGLVSSLNQIVFDTEGLLNFGQTEAQRLFFTRAAETNQDEKDLIQLLTEGESTAEEIQAKFLSIINSLTSDDLLIPEGSETSFFEQILRIQDGVANYIASLRQQEQAIRDANNALDSQRLDLFIRRLETQGREAEALALQRAREIEALQEIDEANREMGLDSNLADLQALIFLQEDYNTALQQSQDRVSAAYDSLNEAMSAQRDALNETISDLESMRLRLSGALRRQEETRLGSFDLALRELSDVLIQARTGNFSGVGTLDLGTLTAGDTSNFRSRAEFTLSQAGITNQLRELEGLVSEEEANRRTELQSLEDQLTVARQQRDSLLGIEESQLDLDNLTEEIKARDAEFQLASTNLQSLQLASLDEKLTAEQQEALNDALMEAQELSFQALLELTEDQRDQIVEHLTSLISSTDSNTEAFIAAVDLLRLDIADVVSRMDEIWVEKQTLMSDYASVMEEWKTEQTSLLTLISESSAYMRDSLINDDRRKVSLPNSHYNNQLAMIAHLEALLVEGDDTPVGDDLTGVMAQLQTLNDTLRELTSNQWHQNRNTLPRIVEATEMTAELLSAMEFGDGDLIFNPVHIVSELERLNATVRELTSNQWHQNRNTLPKIVAATEYMRDSLINDDRRKVSLPFSHYKGLFGIQAATEKLASGLINDNRQKVSLPNSHYALLTRNAEASEYLVDSLINDDRRKVSLPNSHYNNQKELIVEVQELRKEMAEMAAVKMQTDNANLKVNAKSAEILQRFEIDGIDVNETSTV